MITNNINNKRNNFAGGEKCVCVCVSCSRKNNMLKLLRLGMCLCCFIPSPFFSFEEGKKRNSKEKQKSIILFAGYLLLFGLKSVTMCLKAFIAIK